MLKIRSYIFIFVMCISMLLYWPLPVIGQLFLNERTTYRVATFWGDIVLFLLKYILGITYRVTGAEKIPNSKSVVLSKHQSALDIFVLLRVFDPQVWVFKKEILKIPCFGWAVASTKPIAIDRSAGRKALRFMLERGTQKLKKGFWVVLYPEGTRTLPGQKGSYKGGGVSLAKHAEVDIVPVALNTGLFWQKGKGIINNGEIDIVIGDPITTKDKDPKVILSEVEQWIEENSLAITLNHPHYLRQQKQNIINED